MIGEADYRNVISAVRTPRLAVLIDENNRYWRTAVASLIRIFSRTWGGKYFLIVPTDGKRIKDKFWELLEAYSPDYLGMYQFTLADLQEADPARYEATAAKWRADWEFDQDFDESFKKQQYHLTDRFEIDQNLQVELRNRLNPFHHDTRAVRHRLVRGHGISFPFTDVADINPHAHRAARKLLLPKEMEDPDLKPWCCHSRAISIRRLSISTPARVSPRPLCPASTQPRRWSKR